MATLVADGVGSGGEEEEDGMKTYVPGNFILF
jgi:hypothetical protein